MNETLKQFLIDEFGLAADAETATARTLLSEKLASGELKTEKYEELLTKKVETPKEKAAELADSIATKVSDGISGALKDLVGALKSDETKEAKEAKEKKEKEEKEAASSLSKEERAEIEKSVAESIKKKFNLDDNSDGGDAKKVWEFAAEDETDPEHVRVKAHVERFSHTPTALVYRKSHAKSMGLDGRPILVDNHEVNMPTERTKHMCAVWLKFQILPESLNEREVEVVKWILHNEKFHLPNDRGRTDAVYLTEKQRQSVWHGHKSFYSKGTKAVIDDTTSGGENAVPEFFDFDMITTPTLASEDIPSFCNNVMVPRGSSAENFIIGRPTISAANTEGSAVSVFGTSGFITNHDTSFFRAAGFIEVGRNFAEDAHPRLVSEIQNQYMNSVKLWLNEQIMAGDGTTEPQGITVDTGTGDITPANPTTGAITLADVLNMLFGVGKAHRERGGRGNAIYSMTDQTYKLIRSIATGVTGDTRLVFGDSVEDYMLFGHPVLIEENGLSNADAVFCQMQGYRLYQRQGARFIREDRGDTQVRQNTFLIGVDVRYGGQLDEPNYAAVVDAFPA